MWSDKLGEAIKSAALAMDRDFDISAMARSADFESIKNAINQGIDSHLEAVRFTQSDSCGRFYLHITPETLHVLVRRLMEASDENSDSLASGICETLGIELI